MSGETLLTALRAIVDGPDRDPRAEADPQAEADLLGWTGQTFSQVLLDLPVDRKSFLGRFERSWDRVIDELGQWCTGFRSRPVPYQQRFEPVFGYLGLLLVTLVSLRHADEQRYRRLPDGPGAVGFSTRPSHDCRALCTAMLAEAPVREAIRTVYAPDAFPVPELADPVPDRLSRQEWDRIDFDTLRFHRHGTTSFILTGLPRQAAMGQRRPLALKCIVYPYLRVPSIVRATREYLERYGTLRADVEHVAGVWASSHGWILMDYVDGETLAEHLDRRLGIGERESVGPAAQIRIDLLAELGRQLFSAMADLDRAGLRHHDLSPSNIIVQRRSNVDGVRFVLVDLGVNHLYTYAMPGLDGPDSVFVAPEIRSGDEGARTSDLYSIGQLLIAFSGGPDPADGLVPDRFYAETPVMARFVEDLIGREPEHRLLIFTPDPGRPLYPQLRAVFDEELTAMAASRPARTLPGGRLVNQLADLVRPLAGAPGRQRRIWRIRRSQQLYRDPRRSMHVRWLLFWSWLSASAWYLGSAIVITWWLRDLGWDWGNQVISLLQRAAGTPPDEFPYLDALRAPDYPVVDPVGNLPIRIVAISFLLAGARYYQNLFAGLTPLVVGRGPGRLRRAALLAELLMRLQSVAALLFILPPTLIQRDWWPVFTAIGITVSFLANWRCLAFARAALRQAADRGLSTVPARRVASLESFADWTPSQGFYAAGCWVIGLFIYFGFVEDVFVYAGAVAAINVVLFYLIKCSGGSAANVRIGLGRAFLAAERVRLMTGPVPGQPGPQPEPRAGRQPVPATGRPPAGPSGSPG